MKKWFMFLLALLPGLIQADVKNDIKNSVVRITTSYQMADYYYPWRWLKPAQKSGQGIIIAKDLVLTQASTVLNAKSIEVRLESETSSSVMQVLSMDLDSNLALLKGLLPVKATPMEIPEKSNYAPSAKIEFFWKTESGRFLAGSAVIDRVETFRKNPSFQPQLCFACANATTAGGYGEPVFLNGQMIGLAMQGSGTDIYIMPNELIHRCFDIKQGESKTPTAVIGFKVTACTQPYMREQRGLKSDDGGCLVSEVYDQGSGSKTLKVGDIILKLGQESIDAWGRYEHKTYGTLSLTNIISAYSLNDTLPALILREDKKMEVNLDLSRIDDSSLIIPYYRHGEPSDYYIIGGFVFQNLSIPYLKSWGEDWHSKAPEDILVIVNENKLKVKNDNLRDVVIFSHTLAHPVNRGFNEMGRQIITKINGQPLKSLRQLKELFEDAEEKPVMLEMHPGDIPLYLSPRELKEANDDIKLLYGLPALEHFGK